MFKVMTNIEELKGKEIKYIELAKVTDDETIIITKDNCVFVQNLDIESEWCIATFIYDQEKINKELISWNGNNYFSKLFIKQGLITKNELKKLIKIEKEKEIQKEVKKKQDEYNKEYQEYLKLKEKFETSK